MNKNTERFMVKALIKFKGKTIAADITDLNTNQINRVSKNKFLLYKDALLNAVVTKDGIIRGKQINLPTINISEDELYISTDSGVRQRKLNRVNKYSIMYEDKHVLDFNKETDEVQIFDERYLPFAFRNKKVVSASFVLDWLINRVSNINRTYMNMIYIARKVGRDRDKVIKDSSGVSFTDNFWIKNSDVSVTWSELKKMRDENTALSWVALTGEIKTGEDLMKGFTSLFTTKGYFPKAILGGFLYKLKKDAYLEFPAYLIGSQIGVNVAECIIEGEYVRIKIFTDFDISLVHASELKDYFNSDDEVYNSLLKIGRRDIARQLQRMYIFNYIIGNPDLHDDNYGLLFDSKTFELKSLCPCYDHNVAFQEGFDGLSRTTLGSSALIPLDDFARMFIRNHSDIVENLKIIDLSIIQKYLTDTQLRELKERISNVINWYSERN